MKKGKFKILLFLIIFLIGGLVGFLIGAGYSGWMIKSYLVDSNASWLSQHITRLAMLRNGNMDGCIASIEKTLDNCVLQITWANKDRRGRIDPNSLPLGHLRALQAVRVYVDAGYDVSFSDDSVEMLSLVKPLEGEGKYCSPDLRSLQERASER